MRNSTCERAMCFSPASLLTILKISALLAGKTLKRTRLVISATFENFPRVRESKALKNYGLVSRDYDICFLKLDA